jgi:hypothetical protein
LHNSFTFFTLFKGVRGYSAMVEQHTILGGKVPRIQTTEHQPLAVLQLFRRQEPPEQHEAREPLQGKRERRGLVSATTRKAPQGEIKAEKTFRETSDLFLGEYDIITQGQRSKVCVKGQQRRSQWHLVPFFGHLGLFGIIGVGN